jgi:hypothetical protein
MLANDGPWEQAIHNAELVLCNYVDINENNEYSDVITTITSYLYLAKVWKHQSLAVLEWLEKITFDPKGWKNKKLVGPSRGKMGRKVVEDT